MSILYLVLGRIEPTCYLGSGNQQHNTVSRVIGRSKNKNVCFVCKILQMKAEILLAK